jgi:hypothetical protein
MGVKQSFTLREEHTFKVFENRFLRRIGGPKKEEVAGGCRRLFNEELHNLYAPPNTIMVMKSRGMRLEGRVACMEATRTAYRF